MVSNISLPTASLPTKALTDSPGFVYSQTTDRLWRKNRQPVSGTSCPGGSGSGDGRDIARNWPYQWDAPFGASNDPCNEKFRGFPPVQGPYACLCPNHT